ncbi:Phosphotransferase system lactose/cellobiose-specific IIB subunit [Tepidanaerobacter acetatoxydans Re1]|uniref:Phosphotransferase system lactose/cellobiose-specific IIB subunit n=2 Tax=Tepidanaerobacter acetatoxydans TaxID=499229 RepID=U4QJH6_TEPAE|nr:Phosphotransferase system lactose/cellobiose-specific IIB subunit [Tepidanaerobacter acetatoxydans Re1]
MMKILTVCGLGQGSSLILRMNVESVLKELGIEADVDNSDVSTALFTKPDVIMTNKELAENLKEAKIPILIVKNYFDKDEIKEVLQSFFKK